MNATLISSLAAAAALLTLSGSCADAQSGQDDMAPFPAAEAGQTRHVIRLPAAEDEDAKRVSVIVGRTMLVDCNRVLFSSHLEERTAEGWGFNYYVVTGVGGGATTRMACPTQEKTEQFVRSADEPMLRYNSRLPLVVYAPNDIEVRYRVWSAGAEQRPGT
ncbi:serine protease inhibitor ecotin [Brevundimonas lenta]|uniref:Ecotin n=1 Tax=Brevundimonas lenta TaxID=424796 RepID=A0A7W6NP86_9CAUL|nr:serine protease inhibitor ecotin [Brevundimonas lenta]MBB4083160.1 ecotin [Brevundimonas lenta]